MKTQIYTYLGRLTLTVTFLIAGLALSSPSFAQGLLFLAEPSEIDDVKGGDTVEIKVTVDPPVGAVVTPTISSYFSIGEEAIEGTTESHPCEKLACANEIISRKIPKDIATYTPTVLLNFTVAYQLDGDAYSQDALSFVAIKLAWEPPSAEVTGEEASPVEDSGATGEVTDEGLVTGETKPQPGDLVTGDKPTDTPMDSVAGRCFGSDGQRFAFSDAAANAEGTEAFAFHPFDTRYSALYDAVIEGMAWRDCKRTDKKLKKAKQAEDEGWGDPAEVAALTAALCTLDEKKAILTKLEDFMALLYPPVQRYTVANPQHDADEWLAFPSSLATLNLDGRDLTFVLENHSIQFVYDMLSAMLDDLYSLEIEGKEQKTELHFSPARVAVYEGDTLVQELEIPSTVDPTDDLAGFMNAPYKIFAYDNKVLLFKRSGGGLVPMKATTNADPGLVEQEFESGLAQVYALKKDSAGTFSLELEKEFPTNGVRPVEFLQHNGMMIVNQGGMGNAAGGKAVGSLLSCDENWNGCKTDPLTNDGLLAVNGKSSTVRKMAILDNSLFFTKVASSNLKVEFTLPSTAICLEAMEGPKELLLTQVGINIEGMVNLFCNGMLKVMVDPADSTKVKFISGGVTTEYVGTVKASSPLVPETTGDLIVINDPTVGEFVIDQAGSKLVYQVVPAGPATMIFHFPMEATGNAGEYQVTDFVAQLKSQGEGSPQLTGTLPESGGFSIKYATYRGGIFGEFNLETADVVEHFIGDEAPITKIGPEYLYEYKHNATGIEIKMGFGLTWTALDTVTVQKGSGQPESQALLLGSKNSVHALLLARDESGALKNIGIWQAGTSEYENDLDALTNTEAIKPVIDAFLAEMDPGVDALSNAVLALVNGALAVNSGAAHFDFLPNGTDFNVVSRLGLGMNPQAYLGTAMPVGVKPMKDIDLPQESLNIKASKENKAGAALLRFVKLTLATQEALAQDDALIGGPLEVEEPKKDDEFLTDDEKKELFEDIAYGLRTPSEVTCKKFEPQWLEKDIVDEPIPEVPDLAGELGLAVQPRILVLRFPGNCRFYDVMTGQGKTFSQGPLWERCLEWTSGPGDPKGLEAKVSDMIADHLWDQKEDVLEETKRFDLENRFSALVGKESSAIERFVSGALRGEEVPDESDLEFMKDLGSDWSKIWGREVCGSDTCWDDEVRTKIASQGTEAMGSLVTRDPQAAVARVQVTGGTGCSFSTVPFSERMPSLPLTAALLVVWGILLSVRRIAVRVKKR